MIELANLTTMEVDALTDMDGGLNLTDGHARLLLSPGAGRDRGTHPRHVHRGFPADRSPKSSSRAHLRLPARAIGQHNRSDRHRTHPQLLLLHPGGPTSWARALARPARRSRCCTRRFDNIADLFMNPRTPAATTLPRTALMDQQWPGPPVRRDRGHPPEQPDRPGDGRRDTCGRWPNMPSDMDRRSSSTPASGVRSATRSTTPTPSSMPPGSTGSPIEDTGKLLAHPRTEDRHAGVQRAEHDCRSSGAFSEFPPLRLSGRAADGVGAGGGLDERGATSGPVAVVARNRATVNQGDHRGGACAWRTRHRRSASRADRTAARRSPDSSELYQDLVGPRHPRTALCAPFHWADPPSGLRFIRLSLARPFATVEEGRQCAGPRSYLRLSERAGRAGGLTAATPSHLPTHRAPRPVRRCVAADRPVRPIWARATTGRATNPQPLRRQQSSRWAGDGAGRPTCQGSADRDARRSGETSRSTAASPARQLRGGAHRTRVRA